MNDNELMKSLQEINTPEEMIKFMIQSVDDGIFGNNPYYEKLKSAVINRARQIFDGVSNQYPEPWKTINVRINKKTGEIHCDGDEETVQWFQKRMHTNGKVHDTLQSVDALDNLSFVAKTADEFELLEYIQILVKQWGENRNNIVNTLCTVCGKSGGLTDSELIHKKCLENIKTKGE